MYCKPRRLMAASGLAFVAAIISFAAAFMVFDVNGDQNIDMAAGVGLMLLVGVLFLAVAGSTGEKGTWNGTATTAVTFICLTIVIMAYLYDILNLEFTAILSVLSVIIVLLVANHRSFDWINVNRS